MNFSKFATFGLGLLVGIFFNTASLYAATLSDLSSVDLNSPGDRLLTLDSTTGLRWLDLRETFGRTIADGSLPGFRLATFEEVDNLFSGFPSTDIETETSTIEEVLALDRETDTIISIFGGLDSVDFDELAGLVLSDEPPMQATLYSCLTSSPVSAFGCSGNNQRFDLDESRQYGEKYVGVFMVQADSSEPPAAVPEPFSIFGLFAVFAAGVFLKRNRSATS